MVLLVGGEKLKGNVKWWYFLKALLNVDCSIFILQYLKSKMVVTFSLCYCLSFQIRV